MRRLIVVNQTLWRAIRKTGLKLEDIAYESNIPKSTLQTLVNGKTKNPRIKTLRKLEKPLGVCISKMGF